MASSPSPTPWIVSDDCYDIDIIDSILLDHHLEPEADSMPPKHEESDLHVNKKQKVHLDSFGTTTVRIIVGPEKQDFIMHKELLCNTSSYFRAALNGSFKEAKEQKIELEEEDVTTFKHFQYWLYSRTLLMTQQSENDIGWDILVDLFIFGEARGIPHLQNAAIDGLVSKQVTTRWTPLHLISRIYENTPEKSPIRRLFVDWTHWKAHLNPKTESEAWFNNQTYEYFNKQFLYDLSMAYCGRIYDLESGRKDFTAARAEYHVSIPE